MSNINEKYVYLLRIPFLICHSVQSTQLEFYSKISRYHPGVVERIRIYGLVRTKFWENHSRNAIGDDRFYWDKLISPDKVLKSGQS